MPHSIHRFTPPVALALLLSASPLHARERIAVPADGDLQAAINRARPGDVILLEPGATYVGNFRLPPKQGSAYITIRSAAPDGNFPADGRVSPDHRRFMPVIRSPNGAAALATEEGAHHWRLQWLAFEANANGAGDIITLGDGSDAQRNPASIPRYFILEGLIMRGSVEHGQKRAIALNSGATVIRNSDIRGIKAVGQDSQAICGWNGPGPYTIENNYLEAAGENVMFGGADPRIPDLVPSDITFRGNFVTKPLEWRDSRWTVKNLFELKNARRVLIEGNIFEYNWLAAQSGWAIMFTPMNQGKRAPWSVVSDVTFQFNIVRHAASGINILGYDHQAVSRQARGFVIRHNLFYDLDSSRWGGHGRFLMIGGGPADIVVDHNTVLHNGSALHLYGSRDGQPVAVENLYLTNNLMLHNDYGIMGDGASPGQMAIGMYLNRGEIRRNVLAGGESRRYPPDNFFPSVPDLMKQFVDGGNADYRLQPSSEFRTAATDGTMLGANVDMIQSMVPPGDGSPAPASQRPRLRGDR